jgi:hypothetical protein
MTNHDNNDSKIVMGKFSQVCSVNLGLSFGDNNYYRRHCGSCTPYGISCDSEVCNSCRVFHRSYSYGGMGYQAYSQNTAWVSSYRGLLCLSSILRIFKNLWIRKPSRNPARNVKQEKNWKGYDVATSKATETTGQGESVMLFVVSYTLNPSRVNEQLTEELMKSTYWMHYIDDSWIIATNDNIDQLYKRLKPFFQDNDLFFIVEIRQQSTYRGWLPQDAWDWLKKAFEKGWARP